MLVATKVHPWSLIMSIQHVYKSKKNLIFFSAPKLLQPLMQRKQEHEKKRREIKEQWQRAKRKLVCSLDRTHSLPFDMICFRRVYSDIVTFNNACVWIVSYKYKCTSLKNCVKSAACCVNMRRIRDTVCVCRCACRQMLRTTCVRHASGTWPAVRSTKRHGSWPIR